MELKTLFSAEKIGNVKIKNRIIRSATSEAIAKENGQISKNYIDFYKELAKGGTGLIITGGIAINPSSMLTPCAPCLYDDSFLPGQKQLVKEVHEYSGAKICAQIVHPGRQSMNREFEAVAPSAITFQGTNRTPRELKTEEIKTIIDSFVDTGRRVYEAGYDMVQLHGAHGFLLSNFLSPFTNRRNDEYGGNIQNRTRILVEIYDLLRDVVEKSFSITIKLQTQDFIPDNGLTLEEGKSISKIIADTGYDMIEISGGGGDAMGGPKPYPSLVVNSPRDENYFLPSVRVIKPVVTGCKTVLMGGVRNPFTVEKLFSNDEFDFISMSRPLIYEPNIPDRWENGDFSPIKCINCNSCYRSLYSGGLFCEIKNKNRKNGSDQ
ncbi:MAG: oxidoreductase [Promethearchaeota archaeon]